MSHIIYFNNIEIGLLIGSKCCLELCHYFVRITLLTFIDDKFSFTHRQMLHGN